MALCVSNNPSNKSLCVSKRLSKISLYTSMFQRQQNVFCTQQQVLKPTSHSVKMTSRAGFEISYVDVKKIKTNPKTLLTQSYKLSYYSARACSSRFLKLSTNYAYKSIYLLVLQTCNAVFGPKNVSNQAITFWPNFCHLFGKTYAYLDLQPIQILLCLISKISLCQLPAFVIMLAVFLWNLPV